MSSTGPDEMLQKVSIRARTIMDAAGTDLGSSGFWKSMAVALADELLELHTHLATGGALPIAWKGTSVFRKDGNGGSS